MVEVSLRIIIQNPKIFWSNYFNRLDLIIILCNLIALIEIGSQGDDVFKQKVGFYIIVNCMKFLRIFRFLVGYKFWLRGSILFMEMFSSLVHIKEFVIIVFLIILVTSLMGVELFSYKIRYVNDEYIPQNL